METIEKSERKLRKSVRRFQENFEKIFGKLQENLDYILRMHLKITFF